MRLRGARVRERVLARTARAPRNNAGLFRFVRVAREVETVQRGRFSAPRARERESTSEPTKMLCACAFCSPSSRPMCLQTSRTISSRPTRSAPRPSCLSCRRGGEGRRLSDQRRALFCASLRRIVLRSHEPDRGLRTSRVVGVANALATLMRQRTTQLSTCLAGEFGSG
eukprot:247649-Pleurochrysis_carterae.AAC.4